MFDILLASAFYGCILFVIYRLYKKEDFKKLSVFLMIILGIIAIYYSNYLFHWIPESSDDGGCCDRFGG